jgi:large subunit ribosomal protein L37Ae
VVRKKKGSVGRLGVRYGKRVRDRLSDIERGLRTKHHCQYCGFQAVTRISVGIWKCGKCGVTFSGASYSPSSELGKIAKRNLIKE